MNFLVLLVSSLVFSDNEDSTEGIPEGFFDDPKLDAKVCVPLMQLNTTSQTTHYENNLLII